MNPGVLTIALCCLLAAPANAASVERQTTSFRLANGMQWIVVEKPNSGTVTTNLYNDACTVFETPGRTGISQLIGWYSKDAARAAGWPDVRTRITHDHQCLIQTMPANCLPDWLQFAASQFRGRTFPADLTPARQSQFASIEKRSAKGAWLLEELQRVAFLSHPYGQPQSGYAEDVARLTKADLDDFHRTYYVPANLIAVVVGDVQPAQVRALADKHFAPIPGGQKAELRAVEPRQRAERRILATAEDGQSALAVAFHKGAVKEDSYPTWDVLAPAVNARLKATLVDRDALAARVMVHFMPAMKYRGLLAILTFLKPASDAARAEKVIETELDRFVREPLSPEEFTAAVKAWAGPAEMKDEPLAQELADWHAMTGDYRNMFRHRPRVEATTPAQVQSLAAETFRRDGRTVATMSVK